MLITLENPMKTQKLLAGSCALILSWAVSTQAQEADLLECRGDQIHGGTYENVTVYDEGTLDCLLEDVIVLGDIDVEDGAGPQIVSPGNSPGDDPENAHYRVMGSIFVGTDSRLLVSFFSVIDGDIEGDKAEQIGIVESTVLGNVEIKGNSGNSGCDGSTIGSEDQSSDFKIVKNKGVVALNGCTVYGTLKVAKQDPELSGDEEINAIIRQSDIKGPFRVRNNFGGTIIIGDTEIDGSLGNHIDGNSKVRFNENTDITIGGNFIGGNLNCEDNVDSIISDPDPSGSNDVQGTAKNDCAVGFDSTP
jgi:hypothetical protein